MINLDNNKEKRMLSIRDFNVTQLSQHCQPKQPCIKTCTPSCSKDQVCVYRTITECGTCPPTYCMDNSQLRVTAADYEGSYSNNKRTVLIAGLTTGLVAFALIAATVAGFVFYRRRKSKRLREECYYIEKEYSIQPPTVPAMAYLPPISELNNNSHHSIHSNSNHSNDQTPVINQHHHWNQVINYDHPQSPFIIGAQSLQIPHLDDTPDPSNTNTTIRRSLNIQSTTNNNDLISNNGLGRASSVKVTKFDNRFIPHFHSNNSNNSIEDLFDDDHVTLKRAVSVKKNNSTNSSSHSSSMTRVGSSTSSQDNNNIVYAKPTMVRINTILKRDQGGVVRKTSIRTVIDDNQVSLPPSTSTSITADYDQIDFYFCPPPPLQTSEDRNSLSHSQISIQSSSTSSSHSTFGDGSITVFLEPPPPSSSATP